MSKIPRWKAEKEKVKVVFRLQFQATNVPQPGWDKLFVSFIPLDTRKIAAKTNKGNVRNGNCKWADPIYETTRLLFDMRTKKYDEKLYKLVVSMGTSRSNILGEVNINLADFADAQKPLSAALPLDGCDYGTVLHVTVQLLTSKTGFREFEQQREAGERGHFSVRETAEKIQTSAGTSICQTYKVRNRAKLKPDFITLSSLQEVQESSEDLEEATAGLDCSSYTSESVNTEKSDIIGTPDAGSITSKISGQATSPEKEEHPDRHIPAEGGSGVAHSWNSDNKRENDLSTVCRESDIRFGSLKASSVSEIWMEVSSLQKLADELSVETKTALEQLSAEVASGESLVGEISFLKSECLKIKADMEELKHAKGMPNLTSGVTDMSNKDNSQMHVQNRDSLLNEVMASSVNLYPQMPQISSKLDQSVVAITENLEGRTKGKNDYQLHGLRVKWLQDLSFIEDKVKETHSKVQFRYNEADVNILSDFVDLESVLWNLKQGIINSFDNAGLEEAAILNDAQGTNLHRMQTVTFEDNCGGDLNNIMEERVLQLLSELETSKVEQENLVKKMRHTEHYYEALIHELEDSHGRTSNELDALKSEHSRCYHTVSAFQAQIEKMHQDMNEQFSRFAEDRRNLDNLNKELEKRALASESMLKKIRWNYSIAVERLQRDLELLSNQVLSLFETNENLARQAFVEASQLFFDDYADENSGIAFPNKKLDGNLISSVSNRNMSILEYPLDSGRLNLKDSCGSVLNIGKSSVHIPVKDIGQEKQNAEINSSATHRSPAIHDSERFGGIWNKHAQVHMQLLNRDQSIEEIKISFKALQECYSKTEAELSDAKMENVSLEIFLTTLQEILCEKLDRIRHMAKEFDELSQKLCSSIKSNDILQMRLQNVADDVRKLRDSEARRIVECDDLNLKNHILEAKLQDISDENSFLSRRVAECQILVTEVADLDMKYKACNAERLSFENLLKQETTNKACLEKELCSILETNETMSIETLKYRSLVDILQKEVSFANEKLENLCLNFSHQDSLVNEPSIISQTPEQDLVNKILHLEKLHEGANRMFLELSREKKAVEGERNTINDLLKNSETNLQELNTKFNLSNAHVESLQLKLKDVSKNLNSCLEAEKSLSVKNTELSSKLAEMELELQLAITENNHLAERLCKLDGINEELEKTKHCFVSCMQEKESLRLSIKSENKRNAHLENELSSLKQRLTSAENEISRGRDFKEKMTDSFGGLTIDIVEKQIFIDEHISEIADLKLQISDLESDKSKLQHHLFKSEECKTKLEDEKALFCVQVSELETELLTCKKCLRSLDCDLQSERGCRENLDCKVKDLAWQLEEKCEQLLHFEEAKAELAHLHQRLLDLENEKSKLGFLLYESQEGRKGLDHETLLLRSQVADLENALGKITESLAAAHDELHDERVGRGKLSTMVKDLTTKLLQKDEQIQRGNDHEQELNDKIRDLTCTLNEKGAHIDGQKSEIINVRQQMSLLESKKNELHQLFLNCEELQRKVVGENSALRAQISDLETQHHELKNHLERTNFDLQSERDCREKLQVEVAEQTLVAHEKSQQLMCFEGQKTESLHLNQQLLDLQSEKANLQNVLHKNQEHAENLNYEIAVLRSQVAELENGLANVKGSLHVTRDDLQVEKGLTQKLEGMVTDLQSELVEKDGQILALKEQRQELVDIRIQIKHLKAENSEYQNLLLKDKEGKTKLIFENSSLLMHMTDLDSLNIEMLECLLLADLKVTFIETQFSEALKSVLDQLHALDGCYKELQLKYLDAKSAQQLLMVREIKCTEENERLASALLDLKSKYDDVLNEKLRLESFTYNRSMMPLEDDSSLLEDGGSEEICSYDKETKHLRGLLKNFEEEMDSLRSARDELDITIVVLELKLDEQRYHLLMLKEYDAELMKMREQQHELTYRLSEQILKTEEFRNLSIHLKEQKDKADAECMHTHEKKESEGLPVAVQESLRMAFIKEQCETKLQEMKNQLSSSKKYGEELLIKLQNAVDEVEFRKKYEVSHLKRNEDLLVKLTELEEELKRVTSEKEDLQDAHDRMKVELEFCSNSLDCCRDEKLKLEASLRECNEDRTKNRVELDLVRRRLEILSSSVEIFERDNELGSPNSMSFGQVLDGKKLDLSLTPQQFPAARNICAGNDASDVATARLAKGKDNLIEADCELKDDDDKLLPPKYEPTQDILEKIEGLQISDFRSNDQASLLQYNVDFKEQNKERETLQNSLELLHKELETLKIENLASHIPFDEHHVDPDLCGLQQELAQLDMANEQLGNMFPSFKGFSGTGNALEKVLALELELAEALQEKKDIRFQSSFLRQHDNQEAIFESFKDINELIQEMLALKGRYAMVESELKEMQARYSQLSLQFAEVEGERQKLMLTLKNRMPQKH